VREYHLPIDIYTPQAVTDGIQAFAHLCAASGTLANDHTILRVEAQDDFLDAELLNYILALSSQSLLQ
jgi:hypothetical protein